MEVELSGGQAIPPAEETSRTKGWWMVDNTNTNPNVSNLRRPKLPPPGNTFQDPPTTPS